MGCASVVGWGEVNRHVPVAVAQELQQRHAEAAVDQERGKKSSLSESPTQTHIH